MTKRKSIDHDRLKAFEALILWFCGLGFGGALYLAWLACRAAWEWLQGLLLWVLLVGMPAAMMTMSAVGLVTCLRWWMMA